MSMCICVAEMLPVQVLITNKNGYVGIDKWRIQRMTPVPLIAAEVREEELSL